MGDRAQKIRPYPFLFRLVELAFTFCDHLVLFGEFGRHGACRDGNDQHTDESNRIAAQREIDLKKRISEAAIDKNNA